MKALRLILIASIIIMGAITSPHLTTKADEAAPLYPDVPANHIYAEGISLMTENQYVEGYLNGDFVPNGAVNRVEALKMILNFAGTKIDNSESHIIPFPDVDNAAWYIPYVATAFTNGIIKGNDDGTLKPETTVNRAEALKMLVLAMNLTKELPNITNDYWYSAYMAYGKEHALITPDITGDYLPGATLSRGELCDLLYRFSVSPYIGQSEYGKATYYGYSFDGHNTASGTPLEAYGFMAAHKTLAFGTIVRVINTETNLFVDVEIVDRGPYGEGRIIDLTPAAFEVLAPLSAGILNVRLEVLSN